MIHSHWHCLLHIDIGCKSPTLSISNSNSTIRYQYTISISNINMLFFFLMALYFIHSKKWHLAALTMALSIAVKLVPILTFPLFLNKLGWRKSIRFYVTIGVLFLLLFWPFLDGDFIENYSTTIGLWFSKFEFNASFYYFLKWGVKHQFFPRCRGQSFAPILTS